MEIAVVIPLFNGAAWIHQTLLSVLTQTFPAREIVLVDDGSEDGSAAIVSSFPQVTLFRNPLKGTHLARQFGLEQTTAEAIIFLDQDDIWHPQHLEVLSTLLQNHPQASAAIPRRLTFASEQDLHFAPPELDPELFDPWSTFPFHRIDTPSYVLIRRKALEAIGGWPTGNGWSSDVEAWFRLGQIAPMVRNSSATAAYRVQHRQATSYQWRLARAHEYFVNVQTTCTNLVTERIRSHPEEAEKRWCQVAILEPMAELIQALETHDSLLCRSALSRLASPRHDSDRSDGASARDLAISTLRWYLQPTLDSCEAGKWPSLIRTLYKGQPLATSGVGPLIPFHPANDFPTTALWSYLIAEPWQIRAWWHLARYRAVSPLASRIRTLLRSLAA